jgi:hypothetical protein
VGVPVLGLKVGYFVDGGIVVGGSVGVRVDGGGVLGGLLVGTLVVGTSVG